MIKKCTICGKEFNVGFGSRSHAMTCSAECSKKHHQNIVRRYRAEHIEEYREYDRERWHRRFAADPEKERARQREKARRRKEKLLAER